jgi:hypothetical protein
MALIGPLKEIYGVSDKVLMMALSQLFLGASRHRRRWLEVGGSMIAVDTLVHNFLHRTGILAGFRADHAYGVACYRPGGCVRRDNQDENPATIRMRMRRCWGDGGRA